MATNNAELEYVQPTRTRKGYWRRKRFDMELPSVSQRKTRALFAKSAHKATDDFGTIDVVGKDGTVKEVPKTAVAVQGGMKDVKFAPEKTREISDYVLVDLVTIRKMAETLREIKQMT